MMLLFIFVQSRVLSTPWPIFEFCFYFHTKRNLNEMNYKVRNISFFSVHFYVSRSPKIQHYELHMGSSGDSETYLFISIIFLYMYLSINLSILSVSIDVWKVRKKMRRLVFNKETNKKQTDWEKNRDRKTDKIQKKILN